MMDVGRLLTLREVIHQGSFSAAAQELSLTQPAVSRQVSLLERQLGVQLVLRTRQGARPTEAGRLLAEHADAIRGRLSLAQEQLDELRGVRSGLVRLGTYFSALVRIASDAEGLCAQRHPGLRLVSYLHPPDEAFQLLLAGQLELAIVFDDDFEPRAVPPEIRLVHLFDDPIVLLLPPRHRLARRRRIALCDVQGETWIKAHEGSAARLVEHLCRRDGLDPRIVLAGRGDEPIEVQGLVAGGAGVALMPALAVWLSDHDVVVRPIADAPIRHVSAALLRDQRGPGALAVLELLGEIAVGRNVRS